MANATGPFGLKPIRHLDGSPWNGAVRKVYCSANYATALFIGDPVIYDTTLANKDTTGKYLTVIKSAGTAGTLTRGVIIGFDVDPTNLELKHRAASTERYAYITTDPNLIYAIRGSGVALTKVCPGQNAVMIATTAGSTTTGLSGMSLDEGTTTAPNTTQNFTLHILGVQDVESNELGANAVYEVLLNTPENATGRFLGVTAS